MTMADVIRAHRDGFLSRRAGSVTSAQVQVLDDLSACRTGALGGHLYRCDHCGAERIAYNSCRNRHCPSCQGSRSAAWLDARRRGLLDVPYAHAVFTVPEEVAALALGNKKVVYDLLLKESARTLREIAADPRHLGAEIGFLSVLHTWTQTLLHHPHVHCVVPAGGLSPDGQRWIGARARFFLPVRVLSRLFRGKLLNRLDRARDRGELCFGGSTADLSGDRSWKRWLARQYRKEWVVYVKPPFGSPEQVLKYLARYTHRVAISDHRLVSMQGSRVAFRYRDRRRNDRIRTMTLEANELLCRFLRHVLPRRFVRIRHFGLLANGHRTVKLARCRDLLKDASLRDGSGAVSEDQEGSDEATQPGDDAKTAGQHRCPVCQRGTLLRVSEISPHDAKNWREWRPP